jgi:hypothetical protein
VGVGTGEGSCALSVVDFGGIKLSGYTARDLEFLMAFSTCTFYVLTNYAMIINGEL